MADNNTSGLSSSCAEQDVAGAPPSTLTRTAAATTSTVDARAQLSTFPSFGFSQGYQPQTLSTVELGTLFRGIAETGARAVRLDLPWSQVQAGGPALYDWSNTLRVFDSALAQGLSVLPVAGGVPAWLDVSDDCDTSYMNFLYQAGLQLIPRGILTVELWNEANLGQMSPQTYTNRVLIPGATGFRTAGVVLGATVSIISTGLAPAPTWGGSYSQRDFLAGIYENGGKEYFDAVGHHPYTWPANPSIPGPWNWMLNTTELRTIMVRNGDRDKQIWATEFGVPTNSGSRGVSEATQAAYLTAAFRTWSEFDWSGPMIVYAYRDLTRKDGDPEHNFGILRSDGTFKPGWRATVDAIAGL